MFVLAEFHPDYLPPSCPRKVPYRDGPQQKEPPPGKTDLLAFQRQGEGHVRRGPPAHPACSPGFARAGQWCLHAALLRAAKEECLLRPSAAKNLNQHLTADLHFIFPPTWAPGPLKHMLGVFPLGDLEK